MAEQSNTTNPFVLLLEAVKEHLQAHDKIARDAQFTRCGCFSCDSFREALAAFDETAREIGRLREALVEIRDHWATDYDHPKANSEMYRGPYGIGIVDGHRACAAVARAALNGDA